MIPAQVSVVVPPDYADRDGPGIGELAGLNQAFRQQVLVEAAAFAELRGRTVGTLWVRRDIQFPVPLRGGKAQITITLSDRARHPSTISATFADNRGPQPAEVFRGVVDIPDAPAPRLPPNGPPSPPWSAPTAIEFAFSVPFPYRDGHLCVEIEGRPVVGQQSSGWSVDHAAWVNDASYTMVGRTGDPRVQAIAVWLTQVPGTRLTMFVSGPTQTTVVGLVGRELQPPLDLRSQGVPQNMLHVEPFDAVPLFLPRVKLEAITRLEHPLQVPPMACFFGARVAIQWLNLPNTTTPAQLISTHAQVMKFASTLSTFPGATVRSARPPGAAFPDVGVVQVDQMPVLRFVAR